MAHQASYVVSRARGVDWRTRQFDGPSRHAEQVVDALMDYYDLGITTFLIRGFEPLKDALKYGRSLLPATRHLIATRTRCVAAE